MVGEAIEQCGRHLGIAEDAGPFAERQVGGDDDRGALVEPADQMEEQLPASLGEGQIAEFIEDDEVEPGEVVGDPALFAATMLGLQAVDQIDNVVEAAARAVADQGACYIDIAEVQTAEGKLHLFVAIDRTSKFAYVELHQKAGKLAAAQFLRNLIAILPYAVHTVLTDNGIQFTNQERHRYAFEHIFDPVCHEHDIEHRLTKIKHPWTNSQVERMNRTIKEATVKRFHYDDHDQLRRHLDDFTAAYNFARRLKTLKGLTPYEFICKAWTNEPQRFNLNPIHQMPGLHN